MKNHECNGYQDEVDAGCSERRHPIDVTSRWRSNTIKAVSKTGKFSYVVCNIISCLIVRILIQKNRIINRVPASTRVKAGKSPLPGDPVWNVITGSGEVISTDCYIRFAFDCYWVYRTRYTLTVSQHTYDSNIAINGMSFSCPVFSVDPTHCSKEHQLHWCLLDTFVDCHRRNTLNTLAGPDSNCWLIKLAIDVLRRIERYALSIVLTRKFKDWLRSSDKMKQNKSTDVISNSAYRRLWGTFETNSLGLVSNYRNFFNFNNYLGKFYSMQWIR